MAFALTAARLIPPRGFWGRSLDEFRRVSQIVWNLETIKGVSGPYELHNFHDPNSILACKVMSDRDHDGFSIAHLDWVPGHPSPSSSSPHSLSSAHHSPHSPSSSAHYSPHFPSSPPHSPHSPSSPSHSPSSPLTPPYPPHARFHGHISLRLPSTRPDIHLSGYAGFRTLDLPPTLFGRGLWDIDNYRYLALRVCADARSYLVNVATDSIVPTDLQQHRLFCKRGPGVWDTVRIRWNDLVRTNGGWVVEPQTGMLRHRVRSIGIGLTDRVEGPFDIRIERIWATNKEEGEGEDWEDGGISEGVGEVEVEGGGGEGELRNKKGERVRWKGGLGI